MLVVTQYPTHVGQRLFESTQSEIRERDRNAYLNLINNSPIYFIITLIDEKDQTMKLRFFANNYKGGYYIHN